MPLLIALVQFLIGAAVLVALAMFVLPIFFFVIGIVVLFVIGMGVYRTYFATNHSQDNGFATFTRGFSAARPPHDEEPEQTTIIEGEYTVMDENKNK